jgi:hypothetical protein
MDQLIREATDIVLCLRNVNMEESLSLNRLRSLSFTPCKKGSKKHSPRVEQSHLLRHSYLILITGAHMNKAYYSTSQR